MAETLANLTDDQRDEATWKYSILEPHFKQGVTLREIAREHQIAYRTVQSWKKRYLRGGLRLW